MKNMYELLKTKGYDINIDINQELIDNPYLISKVEKSLLEDITYETIDYVVEEVTLPETLIYILKNIDITPNNLGDIASKPYLKSNTSLIDAIYDFIIERGYPEEYVYKLFNNYGSNVDIIINHLGEKINNLIDIIDVNEAIKKHSGFRYLFNEHVRYSLYVMYPFLIDEILKSEDMPLLNNEKLSLWKTYYKALESYPKPTKAFDNKTFVGLYAKWSYHNQFDKVLNKNPFIEFLATSHKEVYDYYLFHNYDEFHFYELSTKYGDLSSITDDQFITLFVENKNLFDVDFLKNKVIELYNNPKYLKIFLKNHMNELYYIQKENYECKNIVIDYYFDNIKNYRNNSLIVEFYIMRDYNINPHAKERLDEFLLTESFEDIKRFINNINLFKYDFIKILLDLGIDISKFLDISIEEYYLKYVNHYQKQDERDD